MDRVTTAVTTTFEALGILLLIAAIAVAAWCRYGPTGGLGMAGVLLVLASGLLTAARRPSSREPEADE